ncbi:XdhC/CoxI family protein [Aliiglaciecola sp. LCG003]|uniref:XdhC family protein n=1 Tax=Aliiglaciecola sp. LCG003 TaxID=3053655 RepID=UPI0025725C41|nr:XdhC/CoxI family protein [Aliiglaciecola sp. LCG003]WJG07764.1 XdhC family protein [Aliiglaciecola sp. LCG003]
MSNHVQAILQNWWLNRDSQRWVLTTIVGTQGSSYRKTGAYMMINDLGQYFGLLSGGCLESDIMLQARKCWHDGKNRIIQYDMREEEDLAWQLGIGCGGLVKILLQPVSQANHYLGLDAVLNTLETNQFCQYVQKVDETEPDNQCLLLDHRKPIKPTIFIRDEVKYLHQVVSPPNQLVVFGAGVDARPVVAIAARLGWKVTLVDPRVSYARQQYFADATLIIRQDMNQLLSQTAPITWLETTDAILIMTHNIGLDAKALQLALRSQSRYVGVLGPEHRTERVFKYADMQRQNYPLPLANPAGLRLGGELPESIALSMLAEIHSVLEQADGKSISGIIA